METDTPELFRRDILLASGVWIYLGLWKESTGENKSVPLSGNESGAGGEGVHFVERVPKGQARTPRLLVDEV